MQGRGGARQGEERRCLVLEGSGHRLCRRPSSWGPTQGVYTLQAPTSLFCPAHWLPGATGLATLRLSGVLCPRSLPMPSYSGYAGPGAWGPRGRLCPNPEDPAKGPWTSGPRLDGCLLFSSLLRQQSSPDLSWDTRDALGPLPSRAAWKQVQICCWPQGPEDAKFRLFRKQAPWRI